MATEKLTARFVDTVKIDGDYTDGKGLVLQVREGGRRKSWIYRYKVQVGGKYVDRYMGLGSAASVRLAEARERARQCRLQRLDGIDPLEAKAKAKGDAELNRAKDKTFRQVYFDWLNANTSSLEPDTARRYQRIMEKRVLPIIGDYSIQRFDMRNENGSAIELLGGILKPLRLAGKIDAVIRLQTQIHSTLDWANAHNYIRGDNAASLDGPLGIVLNAKKMWADYIPKNHNALPYQEIGKFLADLRSHIGKPLTRPLAGYALEFIILTAPRRGQGAEARWDEIDWDNKRWNCSKHKTQKKTKKPYVILLNEPAIAVLRKMKELQALNGVVSQFIFDLPHPARRSGGPLTSHALYRFLNRSMGRKDITVHGFRTSFSSWATDAGYDPLAIEMALGHSVGSAVSQIYNRQADKMQERKLLMEAWGQYCERTEPLPAKVIPLFGKEQTA